MASNPDDTGDLEEELASFIAELNIHLAQDMEKQKEETQGELEEVSRVFRHIGKRASS